MQKDPVIRDERTISIENAGYRLAFMIASFGMLGLAAFRGYVYKQDTWDLLGLVVLSNLFALVYQARFRTVHRRLLYLSLVAAALAAAAAFLLSKPNGPL